MSEPAFVSYAQNGEDVVLWRALSHVTGGRYVDVGANSPVDDSVTKAFYDRGWSGVDVEPVPSFAAQLREQRPRDVVVEAAVTAQDGDEVLLHVFEGTGLSTVRTEYVAGSVELGHQVREQRVPTRSLQSLVDEHLGSQEVHFCKIDVEGAEAEVLAGTDLRRWRPWVLVVEATRPNDVAPTHDEWEDGVLAAGYRFCLFDGLSRWYVSDEHAELAPALSYPACSLDGAVPAPLVQVREELYRLQQQHHELVQAHDAVHERLRELEDEAGALRAELVRWRGAVLERWAAATAAVPAADPAAARELEAMRRTVSWRVTAPLRAVRSRTLRVRA